MKLTITFKHLDHSAALDQRISEKSDHFSKYFRGSLDVHWFCSVQDGKHWAECKIVGPGFTFFAKAHADNLYKSLDLVVDKIERQLEKRKAQSRDRIHASAQATPKWQELQQQILEEEKIYLEDYLDKSA
jgi:putative sigma-54 modulation protein